ncbi:MAG: ABC transporter substrate-binding protein [Bacteroidia bacterium]
MIGEPAGLHPVNDNSGPRNELNTYTQVFLIATNVKNNEPLPCLAASLPEVSQDGKRYTYTLRTDMKWDDGKVINAEDVIFTFKANKCPLSANPHAKPALSHIKNIFQDSTDRNKLVFEMNDKYIQNMWMLTDYPIMQRSFYDKEDVLSKYSFAQLDDTGFKSAEDEKLVKWSKEFNDPKYGRNVKYIRGAGPYKIEAWEEGQRITLVRKKDHWSAGKTGMYETAGPDKIVFVVNREPSSYMLEFKKQNYDASTYLDLKALFELEKEKEFVENYNYAILPNYGYSYAAFNIKPDGMKHKKLFTDAKVRKALAMLTPYDEMNKIVYKGNAKRVSGPVSPLKKEYNNNLLPVTYDPEGAKKLLSEAGWKDNDGDGVLEKNISGEKIKLEFDLSFMNTAPFWKDFAQLMAESFYKAGVKANLNPLDFGIAIENLGKHDFDMMLSAWQGVPVPEDFEQAWSTKAWKNGSNFTGWGSASSDMLIDSMNHELNEEARFKLSRRFQQRVYDEQPYIFLFASTRRIAIHKKFGKQEMYNDRQAILLNHFTLPDTVSSNKLHL